MATSCCGGGRCYCAVVEGAGINITGTGAADNPFVVSAAGGGGDTHFYYPETYGAVGDGTTNDQAAIQAAIDAAAAAGGGTVVLWQLYGWSGDIVQKTAVDVIGVGTSAFGSAAVGLIALGPTARYRYGDLSGPSAHPYPGTLSHLQIDGATIGGATELLRIEAVDSAIRDIGVVRGAGHGVVYAAAQNVVCDHLEVSDFPNGTAVLFRNRDDGGSTNTQGAGGCKLLNSHVTTANKLLGQDYVLTNGALPAAYWPHDNFVVSCLFEQYLDGGHHSLAHI
jgi:hypothetical protein